MNVALKHIQKKPRTREDRQSLRCLLWYLAWKQIGSVSTPEPTDGLGVCGAFKQ